MKNKVNVSDRCFTLMHSNIRGFDSKVVSLNSILGVIKPDVLTINETFLKNNRNIKIPGYECFNLNRNDIDGGGVATCVSNKDKSNTLNIFKGDIKTEILVTRHSQFERPINVINFYGKVESRSCVDSIQEQWAAVQDVVKKIEAKGELTVIVGDFNMKIGNLVQGNEDKKFSHGGKLLKDFLADEKYILVNGTKKCEGGPYTRIDPATGKKTILDLCVVSQ